MECAQPATRRWLTALIVGILVEYLLFFALFWDRTGPGDADQYLVFHTLQYWNAQAFGLAKQWTPLLCSGLSMAGEPQIPFMSLGMALSYLLGPLAGVKLSVMIYCCIGWVGAYLYSALWLQVPLQRHLAATLFLGNGFFFCRWWNFYSLETTFERTIFFNRLPKLGGSRSPYALNFASRQCRL